MAICPNCECTDGEVVAWFETRTMLRVEHWLARGQAQVKKCDVDMQAGQILRRR
jgi:hypothetical protein